MSWISLYEHEASCSVEDFYSGVDVWLKRPNVVNKRLLGAVIVAEDDKIPTECTLEVDDSGMVRGRHASMAVLAQLYCKELQRARSEGDSEVQSTVLLKGVVRELLPKMRSSSRGLEAVLTDLTNHSVIFCPLSGTGSGLEEGAVHTAIPACSYRLQFSSKTDTDNISPSRIYLQIRRPLNPKTADTNQPPLPAAVSSQVTPTPNETTPTTPNGITVPTREWLGTVLLPKIAQWSEEENSRRRQTTTAAAGAGGQCRGERSRGESLIPLGRYSQLYAELKEKYGPTLVQNWPEGTDPHKFVYEDIAIATYLLVLWEGEREELGLMQKQSFIDLGCGNGLLVYLLTSEGHPGKGIDLRKRKIWKMYKGTANLEVCSLVPSASTTFPGFDWLIGNHSDELTPWIPLMAARSSYSSRYFVLPCCAHDFNRRFTRRSTGRSQYQCYLDYVGEIGERMGFVVREDKMRIPSSKRICLVGMKRSYPISEEMAVDQQRMEFLMKRCGSKPGPTHHQAHISCSDQWGETITNKHTSNSGAPAPMTTTLSQSGDWERTRNDCTTAVLGAPTDESTDAVAKNVVSSREEHHQLQLKDGSFTINSSLVSPVPLLPPPSRPGTNYSSLSQGQGHSSGEGEGGEGSSGEGTAVSSLVDDSSCQCFAQEPSQVWSRTGSTCTPSPLCLHVVNRGSLSQGCGEEEASLNSPGGVSHSLSSMETGFKPRDPADAVRNCSRIDREVKKVIVETLTWQLLQTENYITVDYQFQDGHASSSSEASISWSLSREEAPPSDSVAVVNTLQHQQQHASITTNNAQQQKEEQERNLSGPSERGSPSHSTNGAEPELKSRYCNDNDDEIHVHVCQPHPRASRVEQQQLEGEGEGGEDEGAGLCGVIGGGGSCEGGEGGEDGCDGTPREAMRWNLGGKIHLSEAAKLFDSEVLSQLKKEYGGLQTLLRNEHQIFKVCGGYIQLRNWKQLSDHGPRKSAKPLSRNQREAKGLLFKTKLCWFHCSHPQGCPRRARDCPYAHGEDELRERPNFREILDCSKELVSLT